MNINDAIAKHRLKLPGIFYKPKPEIPYAPEIGAQPDFGLSTTYVEPYQPNPGFSPPPAGVPGLNEGMGRLSELLRQGGAMVPPAPAQAAPLNDSEAGIPAVIAALASIDPTVRESGSAQNFLQSMYGGTNARHQREAEAKTLADQQAYFSKSNQLKAETEIARTQYEGEQRAQEAERKFSQEKSLLDQKGDQAIELEEAKGAQKLKQLEAELKGLPEKEAARYRGRYNFAVANGSTKEQAAALAMSDLYSDQASGRLRNVQADDIEQTRADRKRKLQSAADVDDAQADLLVKRFENYDEEQAIKLAILSVQLQNLGLSVQAKADKPNEDIYNRNKDAFGRAERDLDYWTRQAKDANDILNDYKKSFGLDDAEKSRLQNQRKEAEEGIKKAKAEIDRIKGELDNYKPTGVNNSPKHIPNKPMQGAVPSQYGPGKGFNEGYGPATPPKDQLVPEDIRNKTKASTNPFL